MSERGTISRIAARKYLKVLSLVRIMGWFIVAAGTHSPFALVVSECESDRGIRCMRRSPFSGVSPSPGNLFFLGYVGCWGLLTQEDFFLEDSTRSRSSSETKQEGKRMRKAHAA